MNTPRLLLTVCCATAIAPAQTNVATTITSGNIIYTQGALPVAEAPGAAEVLNGSGGDILYQHWWWFRVAGDTREFTFKQNATATRVVASPLMTTNWPDVDARGLFSADLLQLVTSTGPTSGFLREAMTINNLTAAPLTIELFAYTDYDVAGSGTDNARGNLSSQVAIDATNTVLAGEFHAVGNQRAEVTAFAVVRGRLQDTFVNDLLGWPTGTFGPGDYTGAVQWSLVIPGNSSATVQCTLATLACRPNAQNYGVGGAGTNGVPTIRSEFPVLRNTASPTELKLANGLGNALAALLLNLNSANVQLFGLNILVDLNGVSTLFSVTGPAGGVSHTMNLPGSPVFCGVNIFAQWLVLDPAGIGGLASHTNGMNLVLGSW